MDKLYSSLFNDWCCPNLTLNGQLPLSKTGYSKSDVEWSSNVHKCAQHDLFNRIWFYLVHSHNQILFPIGACLLGTISHQAAVWNTGHKFQKLFFDSTNTMTQSTSNVTLNNSVSTQQTSNNLSIHTNSLANSTSSNPINLSIGSTTNHQPACSGSVMDYNTVQHGLTPSPKTQNTNIILNSNLTGFLSKCLLFVFLNIVKLLL